MKKNYYKMLTRTSKQKTLISVTLVAISLTGYIYKYYHNNVPYARCTIDIEKRKEDHRDNKTNKFGRALAKYGYDNLPFEI